MLLNTHCLDDLNDGDRIPCVLCFKLFACLELDGEFHCEDCADHE